MIVRKTQNKVLDEGVWMVNGVGSKTLLSISISPLSSCYVHRHHKVLANDYSTYKSSQTALHLQT